jgi:hypothetical protein
VGVFVARGNIKARLVDGISVKPLFIILCPVRAMGANDYEIPVGKMEMGANRINNLLELGIKDDHPGTTILDDEFEFGLR